MISIWTGGFLPSSRSRQFLRAFFSCQVLFRFGRAEASYLAGRPDTGFSGRLERYVALLILLVLCSADALANPIGERVVSGRAKFDRIAPGTLSIRQETDRAIIHWQDFSIGAGEFTQFVQPSADSAVLNRVFGGNPSAIHGQLNANGRVYILNPAGILVGPDGVIDTQGFVASTLDISDDDFQSASKLTFSGDSEGSVRNLGRIHAREGSVFLIARHVENAGRIDAGGAVGLAGGNEVVLTEGGSEQIAVLRGTGTVENSGSIAAAVAELRAAGGNMHALAINNSGVIRATTIAREGGRIVLKAESGRTSNSGMLTATGRTGGEIQVLGQEVALEHAAVVDVSGDHGGGIALIGGGFQGRDRTLGNAKHTFIGSNAMIKANASMDGDGGQVAVWADELTRYYGAIRARGGEESGNGGDVEVSGRESLAFNGRVDVTAPRGLDGSVLLDPRDLTIGNSGANDSALSSSGLASGAPDTVTDVTVSASAIESLTGSITLAASRDLSIKTGLNLANQDGNETVTFTAGGNLTINGTVTTAGAPMTFTASSGGVNSSSATLTIADHARGGNVSFGNDGTGGILLRTSIPNSGKNILFSDKVKVEGNFSLVGADITFAKTLDADLTANKRMLSINSSGTTTIAGVVGNTASLGTLKLEGTGVTAIGTTTVKATSQIYETDVTLSSTLTTLTGTDVTFGGAVDGTLSSAQSITINASGPTVFSDAVGAIVPLKAITTDAVGTTTIKGGSIIATTQTFSDSLVLGKDTTFTGTTLDFKKTVDADLEANNRTLSVVSTGTTTFSGLIGYGPDGLANTSDDRGFGLVKTDTGGKTFINGGGLLAKVQAFNDPVSFGANLTLIGTTVTFVDTLNGSGSNRSLTFDTDGVVTLNGNVGTLTQLGTFTTSTLGTTVINSPILKATTQTYNNPVIIGPVASLSGTTLTFNDPIDGDGWETSQLTVSGSTVTLNSGAIVGGGATLKSFTTSGTGTTTLHSGSIKAVTQSYAKLLLGANTALTGSAITLNNSVDADATSNNRSLMLNANSVTTISGTVGSAGILAAIKTDSAGSTMLKSASISATTQTFADKVTLAGTTTLIADAASPGAVTFSTSVDADSNSGTRSLTINATTTTFNGAIGAGVDGAVGGVDDRRLGTLKTDATGSTAFKAANVYALTQSYSDPVTLSSDTVFTGTTVTFSDTLDSDASANNRSLAVNASGIATFSDIVGGSGTFASLTTDALGTMRIGTTEVHSTTQTYNDIVTLAANLTLTGSSVSFAKNVNADAAANSRTLTINATTTTLAGPIGDTQKLASLTTNADGKTTLSASSVAATTQTYNDDVVLGNSVTLTATGGSISIQKTLNADIANTRTLTIDTTTTDLGGTIGDSITLKSLTTDSIGSTTIRGGTVAATTQTYGDAVTFDGNTTLTGATVTFNNTVNMTTPAAETLTINASGVTTLGGIVGATVRLAALITDSAGSTTIKATEINAGTHTYSDDVTVGANAVLQGATGGTQASSVLFGKTINGDQANVRTLEIKASGATTFSGAVGSTRKLLSLTTDAGGSALINSTAITATTQTYNDAVTVGATTTLTGTTVTFAEAVNADDADDARNLTVNASGTTTFAGLVGGSESFGTLSTDSAGITVINGGAVNANTQVFNDAVTLGANATLTGANVTLAGTMNGSSAGTITFTADTTETLTLKGVVGGTASLASIIADSVTIQTGAITTAGAQTYNGPVVIGANVTLTGSAITFNDTINSDLAANNRTLTVNSTGLKTFIGGIGTTHPLGTLTPSGGGGVTFSSPSVDATTHNYSSEAVSLGADVVFKGTTLTFGTVDGNGSDLTISPSGVATLNGAITDVAVLVSDSGGTTVLGANIDTTGTQTFNDAVTLGAPVTLTSSGDVSLLSTVNGGFALTIDTPSTVTFGAAVGNSSPLASLDLNDGVTTKIVISGGSIVTTGVQTYGEKLSLLSDTIFEATAITFPAIAADNNANGHDVTIDLSGSLNLGPDFFAGTISDLNATASGGITLTDGVGIDALTTLGNQSYNSAITVASPGATLNGADITFGSTINGNGQSLTLSGTGVTTLDQAVTGVTSLTLDSGGVTILGADVTTTGGQLFSEPIVLDADVTLNAGAATITLAAVAGNGNSFDVTSTAGLMTFGGAVSGVEILTVGGGGSIAINAAAISTTGTQNYNGAVTLGVNSIIKSTGSGAAGNITFASTLTGGSSLTVNTAGTATFGGTVTTLTGLTTDSGGSTAINANITTAGDQTYKDSVSLGSGAKTLDAGANTIILQSVTGAGSAGDHFTLSGSGTKKLQGLISGIDAFSSVAPTEIGVSGASAISITTLGAHSYDTVTLKVDTTLTGTTIASLTAVNSASVGDEQDLTLDFSTATTLYDGSKIGPTAKINNLAISKAGDLTGAITTVGTQSYTGNIQLNGDTTLTSTGAGSAGAITFDGTINATTAGTEGLTVNTPGIALFKADIGTTALEHFISDDAAGVSDVTEMRANITTAGAGGIEINDTLVLSGAAAGITLAAGANLIELATVTGGGKDFTLSATATTTLKGDISDVATLTTAGAGGITLGNTGAAVTISTTGDQVYADLITLVNHVTLTSTTGAPTFSGTGVKGNATETADLTLNFPVGAINFADGFGRSALGADRIRNLLVEDGGGLTINGAIETIGSQTYQDEMTLATAAVSLTGTDVTINNDIGGPFSLAITASGTTTLSSTAIFNANITGVTIDGAGTTEMNNGGITLTNGNQDYDTTSLKLGADTSLISGNAANSISIAAVVGNGFDLTMDADSGQNLKGNISGVDTLAINGGSDAAVGVTIGVGSAISITTTGNQTYLADVLINGAATLTGVTPSFNSTAGTVQGASNNDDLTLNFSGTTIISGNFTGLQSIVSGSGGITRLSGAITTVSAGDQTYHDDVVLTAATTLVTGGAGDVDLNGTVDGGGFTLTIDAMTGDVTLGDAASDIFSNLASINVSGDAGINISSGSITAAGDHTYQDDVFLFQNTILTGADLLDNSQTIIVDANQKSLTLTFSSDVTLNNVSTLSEIALTDLKILTVNGGGNTTLNGGGFDLSTVSASSLTFTDNVILGNTDVTLKATDVTLSSVQNAGTAVALTLDGGTLAGAGAITLNGAITGVTDLNVGVIQFGGLINLNASVTTVDDQTFYDPITLGNTVTLTGTGTTADLQIGQITGNSKALTLSFQDGIYIVGDWSGLFSITADPGGNSEKSFFGRFRDGSKIMGTLAITTSGSGNFQNWKVDNEKVDPDVDTTLTGGVLTYSEQDSNPAATIFENIVP